VPTLVIDNFAAGLDTRKSALTSVPGTLQRLTNATITPGGEIAKRRAFIKVATLTGSFGLAATESTLYAFTRNTVLTPPVISVFGVSGGLVYQKIPNASPTLTQTDFDTFNGLIYLACYDTNPAILFPTNVPHYYNAVATGGTGKGAYIKTYGTKVYAVIGTNLSFSAVNDPSNWSTGTGAGFINLSNQDSGGEVLTSVEVYYDKLCVFSTQATQLWAVDPDPAQNALSQVLRNSGTIAPHGILQYGSGDVLYLANSGVRSVRARDSSNAAAVSDIGSPIDALLQSLYVTKGINYFSAAKALLEPTVGRFWMIFPNEIFVLSAFPGPKITAWSYYTVPFTIDKAVTCGGRIFLRSGDDLYVYGGNDGTVYDNCGVEIRLPYHDMGKPNVNKIFDGFDMTFTGAWTVKNSFAYGDPDNEETIGSFTTYPTWRGGKAEFAGQNTHFSLRFYNNDALPATISNASVHYAMAQED
jgi:hypothetical protein